MPRQDTLRRTGLSRVETVLLVLIALILFALLVPRIQKVRDTPAYTQTANDLKQLALACHMANHAHKKLPPAFDKFGKMAFAASLHIHLLPHIEQDELYQRYQKAEGKGDVTRELVPTFASPEDPTQDDGVGIQNHAANLRVFSDKGLNTAYDTNLPPLAELEPGSASLPASFVDGTSNTILFATKFGVCGEGGSRYAAAPNSTFAAFFGQNAARIKADPSDPAATYQLVPDKDQCRVTPLMAQSFVATGRNAGILVVLGDGSCRLLSPNISAETWNRSMQPNDKLKLGEDW
jgi:hypothetical protein